jgi:hypothetical protein
MLAGLVILFLQRSAGPAAAGPDLRGARPAEPARHARRAAFAGVPSPNLQGSSIMRSPLVKSPKGLQVRAIAGTYVVLLAFNCSKAYRKGLLGFGIQRKDKENGEVTWLRGLKKFGLTFTRADPIWEPLHDDPRYLALLKKLRLDF